MFLNPDELKQAIRHIVISGNHNLFFNKRYNLVYGKFLKEFISENKTHKINILYYKQPSFIHKVEYTNIINELLQTNIDEHDEALDKLIKKLIANVNFGLLEKGGATAHQSILFKSIDEAVHYQTECGGKINKLSHIISEYPEMITEYDDEGGATTTYYGFDEDEWDVKASYYILNLKDKAVLRNGYRYIKELLLQHHNFKMNQDFKTLITNHINIYSVKTDAFVIDTCNEEKAKQLLEFHDDIGGWKVSKQRDEINLPTVKFNVVNNELIKIPVYESKTIDIKDEYDTDNIIEIVKQNNPIMIRGELPGTGKSYICQKMVDKNYKVIFLSY